MRVEDLPNDSDLFAENVKINMVPSHVKNSFENYIYFKERYGKTIFDLPFANGKRIGSAVIIGSGETLDESWDLLRQWQEKDKGIIVCSSSQISTCYYHGIYPDFCVVFDAKTHPRMFKVDEYKYDRTTLIVHPGVPNEIIDAWKGPIYAYRLKGGNEFNQFLGMAYDFLQLETMPFATALTTQLIFSVFMGFAPIYLVGCDMCGDRFLRYYYEDGEWKTEDWRKEEEGKNVVDVDGQQTSIALIYHKKGLLSALRIDMVSGGYPVFNCSPKTIVTELPYMPLEAVLKDAEAWRKYDWEKQEKIDKLDRFLDSRFTHIVTAHNGLSWVSKVLVGNSDEELTKKFHEMNQEITDYKRRLIKAAEMHKKPLKEIAPNFEPQKIQLIDVPAHWRRIKELRNAS